jgi:hypothetical protein
MFLCPNSVEVNGRSETVKVDSEMPTWEILPEFTRPHDTNASSKIVHRDKIAMVCIQERRATAASTMSEMIQQVNMIFVKFCPSW